MRGGLRADSCIAVELLAMERFPDRLALPVTRLTQNLSIAHDPPGIQWPEPLYSANRRFCTELLPYPEAFFSGA
jgi:hypothetical protein